MAINYGANYTGIDKERYDAGNQFYSQDRFLQGIGLDKPAITFNPSRSNTGIMSAYNPYPIIPQYDGGGGDGGGPFGGIDKGVTADASAAGGYSLNPDETAFNDLEVEEELAAQRNKSRLTQAAQLGLFALNPMGYLMGKGINKAFGFVKDKFFGGDDGGGGGGVPDNVTRAGGSYTGGYHGAEGGFENTNSSGGVSSPSSATGSVDTGSFEQDGTGRQGYSNGGLSKYEVFKLGELGYNTKGGTILEPFGGIKVLRDILRVNKYAYGGIVGMYR